MKNKVLPLILISLTLGSIAQLFLKVGMSNFGSISNALTAFIAVFEPFVFLGLIIYFLSSITWIIAISKTDISYAYPFISLSYVIVAILGWLFLNEKISFLRIIGISIIMIGVYIISKSK